MSISRFQTMKMEMIQRICLLSFVAILFVTINYSAWLSTYDAYAQIEIKGLEPPANMTGLMPANTTELDVEGVQRPIVEKLSDNGQYNIQLRWNPNPSIIPRQGFDMQILFLNPSAPEDMAEVIPKTETNFTSMSTVGSTGYTDPSIILPLMPVESYDITISSDNGNIIWNKTNQAVQGGRAFERVTFEKVYAGPITIKIDNINGIGADTSTDSVTFNARIIS